MNYDPNITIADIPLRITSRLLPALTKFPEAHAAYTATLHGLRHQYGIPQPDEG
jgi:hypothetical protein